MKKLIVLTVLTMMVSLAYSLVAPFFGVRASVANPPSAPSAMPQIRTPRAIRSLPGLEEIRIWLGPNILDQGFAPNHAALTERRTTLDFSSFDMRPPALEGRAQVYDLFYSNGDGTLNPNGSYLTIEAVSNSQIEGAGGGNVAEVALKFSDSLSFDFGNAVTSSVALGSNADPGSIIRAIDRNTQTYAILGNTVGQSQRLRITIGFVASGIDCPRCSILPMGSGEIFFPINVVLGAFDIECGKPAGVLLEVGVTNDSGEGDFRRTLTTDPNGQASFEYSRGKVSGDQITVTGTTADGAHFQCVQIVEWVKNKRCPLESSLQGVPNAGATLTEAREFRDNALARTPRGQTYTRLYYQFSSEAVQIMMFNPMLMLRSSEIIERYKPVIQSMARGEQVTLTRGDLDEIDGFLNTFGSKGSRQLQQTIKGVCDDLKDPQVHAEFGITMIDGSKREMPAHHLPQIIERDGGTSGFLGLCVVCVFLLVRRRDKTSRTKAKACRLLFATRKNWEMKK